MQEEFRRRAREMAMRVLERFYEIVESGSDTQVIAAGKLIIEQAYGRPGVERSAPIEALSRLDALLGDIDSEAEEGGNAPE